ncbi:DnaB-like helicase C-terminal domain-containing protein [Streptomyces olivaceoviridis]|uniref:DnaB-like helicase C-terminal domain-containing protein n=1 Tax=Streptomyces olivaceoviridis TaxID=1921 RepID=UPI0037B45F68
MADLRTGHGITERNSPRLPKSILPQKATVARWPSSSRTARQVTREPQIPVIAISTLDRPAEQAPRAEARPMLNDPRDSGALVEDNADVVILIHRDDVHDKDPRADEADLIVAKHRDGPTATTTVYSQSHHSYFVDRPWT